MSKISIFKSKTEEKKTVETVKKNNTTNNLTVYSTFFIEFINHLNGELIRVDDFEIIFDNFQESEIRFSIFTVFNNIDFIKFGELETLRFVKHNKYGDIIGDFEIKGYFLRCDFNIGGELKFVFKVVR